MKRVGVLISGRGSNLQALIDAAGDGRLPGEVALVVSNRADAAGLARASAAGIERRVLPHGDFSSREAYDAALADVIADQGLDLVCLAGFMRRLGPGFCEAFASRVVNIHPSLLPAFPGMDAQRQAFEHGVKVAGATVHLVTAELDSGPIVEQGVVPVLDDDTAERLAARILAVEHEIYPRAVGRLLEEPWRVVGRRVVFGTARRSDVAGSGTAAT